jgi:hypothetical protein
VSKADGAASQHRWADAPSKYSFRTAKHQSVRRRYQDSPVGLADSRRLAEYIHERQEGVEENRASSNDPLKLMETLASRYGTFSPAQRASSHTSAVDIVSQPT